MLLPLEVSGVQLKWTSRGSSSEAVLGYRVRVFGGVLPALSTAARHYVILRGVEWYFLSFNPQTRKVADDGWIGLVGALIAL